MTSLAERFSEWAHAGVFERLQEALLDELGVTGGLDRSRVSVDSFSLRSTRLAQTRSTGPSPGSKLHLAG